MRAGRAKRAPLDCERVKINIAAERRYEDEYIRTPENYRLPMFFDSESDLSGSVFLLRCRSHSFSRFSFVYQEHEIFFFRLLTSNYSPWTLSTGGEGTVVYTPSPIEENVFFCDSIYDTRYDLQYIGTCDTISHTTMYEYRYSGPKRRNMTTYRNWLKKKPVCLLALFTSTMSFSLNTFFEDVITCCIGLWGCFSLRPIAWKNSQIIIVNFELAANVAFLSQIH